MCECRQMATWPALRASGSRTLPAHALAAHQTLRPLRPGESSQMTWEMLDSETWTLRLHATAAKIGIGRTLVLEGPLREIIESRIRRRRLDCRLVFHRVSKGRPGSPIDDYRRAWAAACRAAGLPAGRDGGLIPCDLRRSAVRNMIRAGVPETVAMRVSGHRTRAMLDRYNIVSEDDLRDAVTRVSEYAATLPTKRRVLGFGHSMGTGDPALGGTGTEGKGVPAGLMAEAGGNRIYRTRPLGINQYDSRDTYVALRLLQRRSTTREHGPRADRRARRGRLRRARTRRRGGRGTTRAVAGLIEGLTHPSRGRSVSLFAWASRSGCTATGRGGS